ncbi:HyaD/HybD family hydrogenase maturation endopeptidase [Accumulibacter sp.]|uniref:HyaD/HybD family hydrogenase maturation endopeptidase n=1 Tax=Accumulibacter sp. TaxID=2053492 RepID=UPI0025DD89B4|nr:HyaD/HybD family hydrogenase maturation endopeptidase [Accumulibacter sp.]MCM8612970.1 HyaD/HybD family hydrogenase maturation endopeptidase [Accumulibacter sp.]MCM8636957.1 HyaD/HybD family hydrogenase maturation endopeptidase [Accumulibacter sp.]MCM8639277.1 HyaD/HybD family hydrogenase maturation endopeptidase [Accumulibacter sp.]
MRVVVLGVGNVLLSDEGLGVRAIERLQRAHRLPPGVEVIDGGTSGMELLEQLEGIDALIMVDAIRAGAPPATPIRLAGNALPVFFRTRLSPHQVGLCDVLASLELLGRSPRHICILGLQPQSLALGMELSREVEEGMPALLDMVTAELASLGLAAPATGCGGI